MFNDNWMKDDVLREHYANKEDLQKEFIACVQKEIGSNFVVLTQDELMRKMEDFHASMEGTDW